MIDAMMAVITTAANSANVAPALLLAICTVESNLNPHAVNLHDGGSASYGLCQLKLDTARQFHKKVTTEMLFDAKHNARIAALLLRSHLTKYKADDCAIAAYNAGICRKNKAGLIRNLKYVRKVEKHRRTYEQILNSGRPSNVRDKRYSPQALAR